MTDCTCNHFPASLGNVVFDLEQGVNVGVGIGTSSPITAITVDPLANKPNLTLIPNPTFTSLLYAAVNTAGPGTVWASLPYFGSGPPYHLWYNDGAALTALDLWRSGTTYADISYTAGKVGIGTPNPAQTLDVAGNVQSSGGDRRISLGEITTPNEGLYFHGISDQPGDQAYYIGRDATAWDGGQPLIVSSFYGWLFKTALVDRLMIKGSGEVGIGRTDPQARLHVAGDAKLDGPLAQVHGRPNVGLASNGSDELFLNFNGAVYWFKGTQGGGSQGGGTQLMKLDVNGDLTVLGNAQAANNIKVYDSGWFAIGALQEAWKDHGLGAILKGVIVVFASSPSPSEVSVAGPNQNHWHDWTGSDYGAFVRMTATQIYVRAGNYPGWAPPAWQTSGYYKIVAWL